MKALISALMLLAATGVQAQAEETYFCETQAKAAVTALTNLNGTVNEFVITVATTDDKTFEIMAKEFGIGEDHYDVVTTGGHECMVLSVTARGTPSKRP